MISPLGYRQTDYLAVTRCTNIFGGSTISDYEDTSKVISWVLALAVIAVFALACVVINNNKKKGSASF